MGMSSCFHDASIPPLTKHALARMHTRHICLTDIAIAMAYGRSYYVRGAVVYVMGRREIASCKGEGLPADRLAGLQVVCSPGGDTVITVYRNNDFRLLRGRKRMQSLIEGSGV